MMNVVKIAVLALFLFQCVNSKGLSSNASTLCAQGCFWSNTLIWDDQVVPVAPPATVDIQVKGTYTIKVDVNVTLGDFDVGFDDNDNGKQTIEILPGVDFKSNGEAVVKLSSVLQVDAASTFTSAGKGTVQGELKIYGLASFGGGSPSLDINTRDLQISINQVEAKLTLYDGTLVVQNNVDITAASTLTGNGVINGTVQCRGNLEPGLNGVGKMVINGDLRMEGTTETTIDISDINTFDHIWIRDNIQEDGDLYLDLKGDYEPLSHSRFIIFNHTDQRGGFDTVRGKDGVLERFSTKWEALPRETYTAVLYDDAASLFVSFAALAAALAVVLL